MSERSVSTAKDLERCWLIARESELVRPGVDVDGITLRLRAFTSEGAPRRIRLQAASLIAAMLGEHPKRVRRALYWQRRAVSLASASWRPMELVLLGLLHDRAGNGRAADRAFLSLLASRTPQKTPRMMALAYLWDAYASHTLSNRNQELWRASFRRVARASQLHSLPVDLAKCMSVLWHSSGIGGQFPPMRKSRPAG